MPRTYSSSATGGGRKTSSKAPFSSAKYSSQGLDASSSSKAANSKSSGKNKKNSRSALGDIDDDVDSATPTGPGAGRRGLNKEDREFEAANVYDSTKNDAGRGGKLNGNKNKAARADGGRYTLTREEAALAGYKRPGSHREILESDDEGENVGGGDDDDEEDAEDRAMAARIRKAAMTIAGENGLQLDEADDEELDSDAAWESEGDDEERWGDVFRDLRKKDGGAKKAGSKPTRQPKRQELNVDLEESEEEQEDDKMEIEDEEESDDESMSDQTDVDQEEDEESVEEEEFTGFDDQESDESEDPDAEIELPSDLSDSDEDSADDDSNDLMDFVASLPSGTKRKADDEVEEAESSAEHERERKAKRRVLPSKTGHGGREEGGEFGLSSASKLDLQSLLAMDPSLKASASALLKSQPSEATKSILKQGTLAAPLPTVVTERLAREAAYEATKAEGDKWGGVMKRVKEAEYLQFPLQSGGTAGAAGQASGKERRRGGVNSSGDLIGGFKPANEMESAVDRLLSAANLKDGAVTKAEDESLQGQDLSVEEIAARRLELRHQRELLFREEARAKRVSKIKSKTYRKLARKKREKAGELELEELKRLDPEAAEAEAIKMETARALERATLKHSSGKGRWAQSQHGAGETESKRREIEDMLARKEKLSQKIRGVDSDEDSDESEDDEDDDEDDIRASALDRLDAASTDAEIPKGLMGMKFMQNAMARKKAQVDEQEEELRKQLEDYEEASGIDSDEERPTMMQVGGNKGRMVFSGGASAAAGSSAQPSKSLPTIVDTGSDDETSVAEMAAPVVPDSANPWLTAAEGSTARARKTNTTKDKASLYLSKTKSSKTDDAKERLADDARVDIDLDSQALLPRKKMPLAEESEDEEEEIQGRQAFKQRDLVAQAFAGDNVIEDFAVEKQRAIEADAPKEEDLTLPGWGAWGGKGVKKNKNAKKFIKTIPGIEVSQRKDFARSNVIITEKKDKKAAKYLSTDLPYPYTSAAQYEASFADPVGSDWNTQAVHQRAVMPRITKKPGAIIDPIKRLF